MSSRSQRPAQPPRANLSVYLHRPTGRTIMFDHRQVWDITDLAAQNRIPATLMQAARQDNPDPGGPALPEPTPIANTPRWTPGELLKLAWLNHPGTDQEELVLFTANLRNLGLPDTSAQFPPNTPDPT